MKTVLKYVGLKLTPHQFRHLAAKIMLDPNPGAYELVRQLIGHKNMQTIITFTQVLIRDALGGPCGIGFSA